MAGMRWGARTARIAVLSLMTMSLAVPGDGGTAFAAGCPYAGAPPSEVTLEAAGEAVACLINRERRRADLGALVPSRRLGIAAWRHSRDMRDHRYFAHDSRDGRTFTERIRAAGYLRGHDGEGWTLGETLAYAPEDRARPEVLVEALMASPPHRRVILDGRHRELGLGLVRGTPDGDEDGLTLTVDYGSLVSPDEQRQAPRSDRKARRGPRGASAGHARVEGAPVTSSAEHTEPPAAPPVAEQPSGSGAGASTPPTAPTGEPEQHEGPEQAQRPEKHDRHEKHDRPERQERGRGSAARP